MAHSDDDKSQFYNMVLVCSVRMYLELLLTTGVIVCF